MQEHWKDKKTVQVAVGATLIIVFAWWMFTGDIPFLTKLMTDPPKGEDGKVQSINLWPILSGMLIQACWIVGASAIGLFSGIWTAVAGAISKASQPAGTPAESQGLVATAVRSDVVSESPEVVIRNLARAVATKDGSSEAKYKTQIRMPYAVQGMMTAIDEGDFLAADAFYAEVKELHGISQTAAQTRAQSRAAKGGDK